MKQVNQWKDSLTQVLENMITSLSQKQERLDQGKKQEHRQQQWKMK